MNKLFFLFLPILILSGCGKKKTVQSQRPASLRSNKYENLTLIGGTLDLHDALA